MTPFINYKSLITNLYSSQILYTTLPNYTEITYNQPNNLNLCNKIATCENVVEILFMLFKLKQT